MIVVNLKGWPGGMILGIRGEKHPTVKAHWVDFLMERSLTTDPKRGGFYYDKDLQLIGTVFE